MTGASLRQRLTLHSLEDPEKALQHPLMSCPLWHRCGHDVLQADDRRIAEAHYKLALTLHFLEDPEKALQHAKKAVSVCTARIARLSAAPGADGVVAGLSADAVSP